MRTIPSRLKMETNRLFQTCVETDCERNFHEFGTGVLGKRSQVKIAKLNTRKSFVQCRRLYVGKRPAYDTGTQTNDVKAI